MTTPTPNPLAAAVRAAANIADTPRERRARTLTGRRQHPFILVAGGAKVGKSYALAAASADPRVERVIVCEVGDDRGAMDEYGAIPGVTVELVEHDGTWPDLVAALAAEVDAARATEQDGDGYTVLAIDSVTTLWTALTRHAYRSRDPRAEWGAWDDLLTVLRDFPGPVVFTAREQAATGGDELGSIRAQRDMTYAADVVVQAAGRRDFHLTGGRSLALADDAVTLPVRLGDLVLPDLLDLLGGAE